MTPEQMESHVDDLIDEWHEGAEHYPGQPLSDYLKMTPEQYARLVENRGFDDDYTPPPLGRTWGKPDGIDITEGIYPLPPKDDDSTDISRAIGQPGRSLGGIMLALILAGIVAYGAYLVLTWEGR